MSADLATVTEAPGKGPGRDKAGKSLTEVTGDEATKVTEAVKAKDSAVTVTAVRKDAQGAYRVSGTKDGAKVVVTVSADLQTVEVRTARR